MSNKTEQLEPITDTANEMIPAERANGQSSHTRKEQLPNGSNGNMNITPQARAARMKEDARILRSSDPSLFLDVVREIAATVGQTTVPVGKDIATTAGIFKDDPDWQIIHAQIVADYDKE